MLYITGEFIQTTYPEPVVTGRQRILSFLWPLRIKAQSRGADYISVLYFEHTYRLWFGRLRECGLGKLVSRRTYDELREAGEL